LIGTLLHGRAAMTSKTGSGILREPALAEAAAYMLGS